MYTDRLEAFKVCALVAQAHTRQRRPQCAGAVHRRYAGYVRAASSPDFTASHQLGGGVGQRSTRQQSRIPNAGDGSRLIVAPTLGLCDFMPLVYDTQCRPSLSTNGLLQNPKTSKFFRLKLLRNNSNKLSTQVAYRN